MKWQQHIDDRLMTAMLFFDPKNAKRDFSLSFSLLFDFVYWWCVVGIHAKCLKLNCHTLLSIPKHNSGKYFPTGAKKSPKKNFSNNFKASDPIVFYKNKPLFRIITVITTIHKVATINVNNCEWYGKGCDMF